MELNIAILTTSVREGRVGLDVANWTLNEAEKFGFENAKFQVVDLANYNLPIFMSPHASQDQLSAVNSFKEDLAKFDAYIFVVAEYNHAPTGAIKNALDFIKPEMVNKPVSFVGYGGLGGIRAIEQLRLILAELQVATVQRSVNFLLGYDFENFTKFNPQPYHAGSLKEMFTQLLTWANALHTIK